LIQAVELAETTLEENDKHLALVILQLASFYKKQDQYALAVPMYDRMCTIIELAYGQEHPETARYLDGYARVLRKLDRVTEAEQLEARADSILSKQ